MKRFSSGLLTGLVIGLLLTGSAITLAESQQIRLLINGQYINCDVQPQIINGRTMVPISIIANTLGATVIWDEINNTVIVNGQGYVATTISNNTPTVNNVTTKSSEIQEFLGYNNKVNNILTEIDSLLSKDIISETEYTNILTKTSPMIKELNSWGELYYYTSVKNLFIKSIIYGETTCKYKQAINNPKYSDIKNWSQDKYKVNYDYYNDLRQQLKAEISRLQKENHM